MSTSTPYPTQHPVPPAASRKLYRPTDGRVFGGVCAGIADHLGWDRTLVRILAVASIFVPGPQVLAYAVFWILMPDERKALRGA